LGLVVGLGLVHGMSTDRWGPSGQLEAAVAAMTRVPSQFGDWVGEDVPHDPAEWASAGIRGAVYRRYKNPRTGELVTVLMVCGRGGPICVHTPDVCYAGAGYRQLTDETRKGVETGDGSKDEFKVARFAKPGAVVPTQLEIYWGWSRDGVNWVAPDNPRLSLARLPALYKLYVIREFVPGPRADAANACESFLRRALPTVRQALPTDR
jgi:hypothetical protein